VLLELTASFLVLGIFFLVFGHGMVQFLAFNIFTLLIFEYFGSFL
jgi:hypothetical protein